MRNVFGFFKKEGMELVRSGKVYITLLVFLLFGVLNPAIAKLTPFLYQSLSASFKEQGITVTNISVNAMTSWQQYYKNLPIELLVFLLLFAGILTNEYQKKTLILMVTKGLKKSVILGTKIVCLFFYFSVCYWLTYGITFAYNAYFWDNSIAHHVLLSAVFAYICGLFLISLLVLFSTIFENALNVLLATGGVVILCYVIQLFPKAGKWSPLVLLSGMDILNQKITVSGVWNAGFLTIGISIIFLILSFWCFQRREL